MMQNVIIVYFISTILAFLFIVVAHEIGHLAASLACGYEFRECFLYFFSLKKENGKWKIEELPKYCREIAVVNIKSSDSSLFDYVFILAAGGIINIIIGIICLLTNNPIMCAVGGGSIASGILNLIPFCYDEMSDGARIFRALNPKTRKLELLDYNTAQMIERDGCLIIENAEKLINSGINYYMIKGYYYKSCRTDLSLKEKREIREKQHVLKFGRGTRALKIS